MMDKKIEEVVNEQLNTELWSCNLYIAFQVYFEKQELPVLALWLKNQR
jgi:ferritin